MCLVDGICRGEKNARRSGSRSESDSGKGKDKESGRVLIEGVIGKEQS